jgi:hypothetical protein
MSINVNRPSSGTYAVRNSQNNAPKINVNQPSVRQQPQNNWGNQPQTQPHHPHQPYNNNHLTSLMGEQMQPSQINAVKAFFIEVPAEHALQYRPNVIRYDQSSVNYLKETIQASSGMVSAASVRDIARNIISPSRQSRGEIGIAESWGVKRLAFFILFEENTRNIKTRSVITGYTNHADVMAAAANVNLFDPNMNMFITSHLNLGEVITNGGRFAGTNNQQLSAHNIIRPVQIKTASHSGVRSYGKTLRPTDISSYISGMCIDENVVVTGNDSSYNTSTQGIASDRKNEISSQYLSKLIRSSIIGNNQMGMAEGGLDFADTAMYNPAAAASGYSREYSLHSSNLMNEITAKTSLSAAGFAYFSELQRRWPNLSDIAVVGKLDKRASTDNRNVSEEWTIPSPETVILHALTHAIPALLNSFLLTTISFTATNQTIGMGLGGNTIQVGISHATGMFESEATIDSKAAIYSASIQEDILYELFKPGETFYLEGQFTLFGFSNMSISLNGGHKVHKSYPNYAASLDSHVLIASDRDGHEMSSSAKQLLDQIML